MIDKKLHTLAPLPFERQWAQGSRLKQLVTLTHPMAVLLTTATSVMLALLATRGWPGLSTLLLLATAMASAQVVIGVGNEWFDRKLDAQSKPWRALPSGQVSSRLALALLAGAAFLSLAAAALLSLASLLLVALGMGTGLLYSARLKRTIWSWLPYALAYPLLPTWVWVAVGQFRPSLLVVYGIAAPFALALHLCNQLRDFDTDAAAGVRSLVHWLGRERAARLCFGLLLLVPLLALASSGGRWPQSFPLLSTLLWHEWVTLSTWLPFRQEREPSAAHFRRLFSRVKWTTPLLLLAWFMAVV